MPSHPHNHLAGQKSPYLLQHADNPVDWYPWGDEAFELARREDKPIFLSIGYSTCHWCHVMEHESFEDSAVAAVLNDAFVCIKVDREERPDIDQVYMTVCQMMTGSGGWPLTIVMTPDRRPFFAATYIPRENLLRLAEQVRTLWASERDRLVRHSGRVVEALRRASEPAGGPAPGVELLERARGQLAGRYDAQWGGFGTRPKFPTPHTLLFLLRQWRRNGDAQTLRMVTHTLDAMRRGGIQDQVGWGFHRYSTDERWLVPHFEKMLYDQALLAVAYTEAWQATGEAWLRETAEHTLAYVRRDLAAPGGAFCSAEDADSEGEEGRFYLWTADALREVLGDDADLAMAVWGVAASGNFREEATGRVAGANILHRPRQLSEIARDLGVNADTLAQRVESMRRRLFEARSRRVRPLRDDKVLADWNGLTIAALAIAGRAFDDASLTGAARDAARFVLGHMRRDDGRLWHRWRDGEAGIDGMLDDHVFMAWGLFELYEATLDPQWLREAVALARVARERFAAPDGGLYLTADDAETLIERPREVYDGAIPSGNSVAAWLFRRIARVSADADWERAADAIVRAFAAQVERSPAAFTMFLCGVDLAVGPSHEVVVAGRRDAADTRAMLDALRRSYLPRTVVLLREPGDAGVVDVAPFVEPFGTVDGHAAAYVCTGQACERPVTAVDAMITSLDAHPIVD